MAELVMQWQVESEGEGGSGGPSQTRLKLGHVLETLIGNIRGPTRKPLTNFGRGLLHLNQLLLQGLILHLRQLPFQPIGVLQHLPGNRQQNLLLEFLDILLHLSSGKSCSLLEVCDLLIEVFEPSLKLAGPLRATCPKR